MGSTFANSQTQVLPTSIPAIRVWPVECPKAEPPSPHDSFTEPPPDFAYHGLNDAAHPRQSTGSNFAASAVSEKGFSEGVLRSVSQSSTKCITFVLPEPPLPQGVKRKHDRARIRDSSPPHSRFEWLVGFDNNVIDGADEQLSFSYTLAVKHKAYAPKRHARVFMIEVDDCASPNTALQWLLEELVEDGDLLVCVHIANNIFRLTAEAYKEEARIQLESIVAKVHRDRAVSIILEFAAGQVSHNDFMSLIKMYQPSMLVVGYDDQDPDERLAAATPRNRFMEYCLEHSPVPVIVARPGL